MLSGSSIGCLYVSHIEALLESLLRFVVRVRKGRLERLPERVGPVFALLSPLHLPLLNALFLELVRQKRKRSDAAK